MAIIAIERRGVQRYEGNWLLDGIDNCECKARFCVEEAKGCEECAFTGLSPVPIEEILLSEFGCRRR